MGDEGGVLEIGQELSHPGNEGEVLELGQEPPSHPKDVEGVWEHGWWGTF